MPVCFFIDFSSDLSYDFIEKIKISKLILFVCHTKLSQNTLLTGAMRLVNAAIVLALLLAKDNIIAKRVKLKYRRPVIVIFFNHAINLIYP